MAFPATAMRLPGRPATRSGAGAQPLLGYLAAEVFEPVRVGAQTTAETVYRYQIRPVVLRLGEAMDRIFPEG